MDRKCFFKFEIGYILIYLNETFPMEPPEFKIYILVESNDEKTAENDRNSYVAEMLIISTLSKISNPNFNSIN